MPFKVTKYTEAFREEWESLVEESINGTFLHKRSFMDYHGERFRDFSLMAWEGGKVLALLPAEIEGSTVYSHRGLSYGAWIFGLGIQPEDISKVIQAGMAFLHQQGIESLYVRSIPLFYHSAHFASIQEAYLGYGPATTSKTFQTAVHPFLWQDRGRRWGARKAARAGLVVSEDVQHLEVFWTEILCPNLAQRHQVKPAHTLEEMQGLIQKFPTQIRLFTALLQSIPVAGVLVFEMPKVVHTQYIASSPIGRQVRALDLLLWQIMQADFAGKGFFSFGVSHDPQTGETNHGLKAWKESLGARPFQVSDYHFRING